MDFDKLTNTEKIELIELAAKMKEDFLTGGNFRKEYTTFDDYIRKVLQAARDIAIQI